MLLEVACSRPPPKEANSGPVSGVEIMRKLSKSHTHNESVLRIKVRVSVLCHAFVYKPCCKDGTTDGRTCL